jgi:hypothetical protein
MCRQIFEYYRPFCRDASVTYTYWHAIPVTYQYKSSHACIRRAHRNAAMNNRIPRNAGNYLTAWGLSPQQEALCNTQAILIQACKLTRFNVVSGPLFILCVVALCNIVDGHQGIVEIHCIIRIYPKNGGRWVPPKLC